jgi:hypothetical protein
MYCQHLFILVLATIALATSTDPNNIFKRDLKECTSKVQKWNDIANNQPPKTASSLANVLQGQAGATVTKSCVFPEVTGSLADAWSSYVTKVVGWYDNQVDVFEAATKACKGVSEASAALKTIKPQVTTCDKFHWASPSGKVIKGKKPNASGRLGFEMGTLIVAGLLVGLLTV